MDNSIKDPTFGILDPPGMKETKEQFLSLIHVSVMKSKYRYEEERAVLVETVGSETRMVKINKYDENSSEVEALMNDDATLVFNKDEVTFG